MTVNQISIFLENKYGKLSEILALLAEEKIRIIAATVADTSEYGILRIIVSDPQKAYKILKGNQCQCKPDRCAGNRHKLLCRQFCPDFVLFHESRCQYRIYVLLLSQ